MVVPPPNDLILLQVNLDCVDNFSKPKSFLIETKYSGICLMLKGRNKLGFEERVAIFKTLTITRDG